MKNITPLLIIGLLGIFLLSGCIQQEKPKEDVKKEEITEEKVTEDITKEVEELKALEGESGIPEIEDVFGSEEELDITIDENTLE